MKIPEIEREVPPKEATLSEDGSYPVTPVKVASEKRASVLSNTDLTAFTVVFVCRCPRTSFTSQKVALALSIQLQTSHCNRKSI